MREKKRNLWKRENFKKFRKKFKKTVKNSFKSHPLVNLPP